MMQYISVRWWAKWRTLTMLLGVVFALIGFAAYSFTVRASSDDSPTGTRLITLYDRGIEISFVSTSATVGDALEDAGVELSEQDRVEPARSDELVASEYTINIYRARPITVVDGATRHTVTTAAQLPSQIAEAAGITLYPEDKTTFSLAVNVIAGDAPQQLEIIRATPFTLTLYGKTMTARTLSKNVDDMLEEKGISLGEHDRVSVSGSTSIVKGMEVRVWREGTQTVTVEEDVAFAVETIQDANRPLNYREVTMTGVNGKRSVTYEITIQDGTETQRTEISSIVLKEAVKQVEIVGTKPEYLPYTGGGTKTEWLAASNIAEEFWGYADFMVQKESGWNPNATNASSGACGLAQALPCSKVGSDPYNPIVSLNWMNGYVTGRYGGWSQAYAFWQQNRWY